MSGPEGAARRELEGIKRGYHAGTSTIVIRQARRIQLSRHRRRPRLYQTIGSCTDFNENSCRSCILAVTSTLTLQVP